jgi:hypothetical protein
VERRNVHFGTLMPFKEGATIPLVMVDREPDILEARIYHECSYRTRQVRTDVLAERPGVELISDAANSGVGYDIRGGYADCFDVLPHGAEMHVHQVSA